MSLRHQALLLAVATITSVIGVGVGRYGVARLRAAIVFAVELVGAAALFFVANLVTGVALVLVARWLTPYYTTLYEISDVSLLIVAMLQALVFEAWRRGR